MPAQPVFNPSEIPLGIIVRNGEISAIRALPLAFFTALLYNVLCMFMRSHGNGAARERMGNIDGEKAGFGHCAVL